MHTHAPPDAADAPDPATAAASGTAVLILANPYSGSGPNRRRVDRLVAALGRRGLSPELVWTPRERAEALSDPELPQRVRCVVSAGGDGSLADALSDLRAHHDPAAVALGTLPIGNENLFARELGFCGDPGRLARAIERGQTRPVDVGLVGGRLFTLMVSAGFDAEVVRRVAAWRKRGQRLRRVGRLSYVPRVLAAAGSYRYPRVTVEADDVEVSGSHAFVFNLPQYGGGLGIGRGALGDDGLLDWVVFEKPGLGAMLGYGLSVVLGRHLGRSDVRHGRARRVVLRSDAPVPVQADGDPAGTTPVAAVVQPGLVRVLSMRGV